MENAQVDKISSILTIIMVVFIVILVVLIFIYLMLKIKSKPSKEKKAKNISDKISKKNNTNKNPLELASIFEFMEFEKVEDNMIIQKTKQKYLMVVECQGVNYDLMSGVEKTGVEEGFIQFLNTLRHPIQLYIQTRTINLEDSINMYKSRIKDIESRYIRMKQQYAMMEETGSFSEEEKKRVLFELTKQTNLYEYGRDIIADTEKMSFNRNILTKRYYIVIPFVPESVNNELTEDEFENSAFSELYTRAQAVIRTISACGVNGKILNSQELVELLYMAYNRDEAEIYGLDKALKAEYDSLYSTSEDIFSKKIKALDNKIEEKAIEEAKNRIEEAKTQLQEQAEERETNMESLIDEMAKMILQENREYVGEDVVDKALEKMEEDTKEKKEGGKKDGQKERRTKKSTNNR